MVTGLFAASLLAPFFLEATPEVRSAYQSLGKIVEDRPMQIMSIRAGYDTGAFGRFGVRNWDVSSSTDRRADVHRHAIYHTEFGPTWDFDYSFADNWKVKTSLTRSWTLYRGFSDSKSERTYHWWQLEQSLENKYLVPFYRIRKCFRGNDYFYFKTGLRRSFKLMENVYVIPSAFLEGGSSRNFKRVFGTKDGGGNWQRGVSSISLRIEALWRISESFSVFGFLEQYEVVGDDARETNRKYDYKCAHNDFTHGGIGLRLRL